MELHEFRILLDRARNMDGPSLLKISGCYGSGTCVPKNEKKDQLFQSYFEMYFDGLLIERSETGGVAGVSSELKKVDCKPDICEVLNRADNDNREAKESLFRTIEYKSEYNKEPLSLIPYYRLIEEIDIAWEEAERKAREEAERKAREEAERKAKEEAERKAKEEAERKAKEEADRKAKEEADRKAKEEADRKAKEEAERKAKEEAERKAKEEAERKAKEEAERKAKEEAERSSYKSLIEDFVSDTKECEYKDGIIFGKKKTIRYVSTPITKHIWNTVVNKSAESDFDDDEYVSQKELGDFIKELNAHFEGHVVFEYLHKNIHANVHLQVYDKLDKNACFVYIKEDNR